MACLAIYHILSHVFKTIINCMISVINYAKIIIMILMIHVIRTLCKNLII